MPSVPQEVLRSLDAALLRLRRVAEAPPAESLLEHAGGRVEVSTVLVVDALARRAVEGEGRSVGDVAGALQVAHSTASRLVERAVGAGMVDRTRDPDDPRRTVLRLTPAGHRLQEEAVRFRTGRLADRLAGWPAEDVATLARLLGRFTDGPAGPPTPQEDVS